MVLGITVVGMRAIHAATVVVVAGGGDVGGLTATGNATDITVASRVKW